MLDYANFFLLHYYFKVVLEEKYKYVSSTCLLEFENAVY